MSWFSLLRNCVDLSYILDLSLWLQPDKNYTPRDVNALCKAQQKSNPLQKAEKWCLKDVRIKIYSWFSITGMPYMRQWFIILKLNSSQ